ncbi:MAG: hypothetical protein ABSE97_05190 [Verrucomicrobiota bacterium]
MLTVVAGVACFLLNLVYVNWFQVPIESLVVVLLFIIVTPCVFILSIPYVILARWFLNRKSVTIGFRQHLIIFAVGSLITILILAIFFPCDAQPYFVGGYLIKNWFGGW